MKVAMAWNPARVTAAMREDAQRALDDAAEFLLEEANRTAPIEEGTLIGSGVVSRTGDLTVAASYDTPYAVRQHEDTRLRHDPGRRARWLAYTWREQSPRIARFLAERMRRS